MRGWGCNLYMRVTKTTLNIVYRGLEYQFVTTIDQSHLYYHHKVGRKKIYVANTVPAKFFGPPTQERKLGTT